MGAVEDDLSVGVVPTAVPEVEVEREDGRATLALLRAVEGAGEDFADFVQLLVPKLVSCSAWIVRVRISLLRRALFPAAADEGPRALPLPPVVLRVSSLPVALIGLDSLERREPIDAIL